MPPTRPGLPANLRLLQKEPNATEARPAPACPEAPDWLDDAARAEWLRLAPCLAAEWKPRYADALAVYCTLLVSFKANPAQFNAAKLSQLRALQAALGLTPRADAELANRGERR